VTADELKAEVAIDLDLLQQVLTSWKRCGETWPDA